MKKNVVLFFFLILNTNISAQVLVKEYINFNKMQNSLLGIFGEKIENDLAIEGYNIPKFPLLPLEDSILFVGYSLVCEVYFTPKCSYILMLFNSTDALMKKRFKQGRGFRIRQRIYYNTFMHYIEDNNKLPYDIIEYFRYQFITHYEDSPEDHAIYGEYIFKPKEDGAFEIINKKIEILQDGDAILRKYHSNFK
jgi:hypothetical protein